MIKANELRTSNRLWTSENFTQESDYEDVIVNVIDADNETVIDVSYNEHSLKELFGIPLTPEWLERHGKACVEVPGWQYQISVGALNWYFRWNTEWYSELGGIYLGSRIQYLHQVQNLFFDLMGNEFTTTSQ